MYPSGGTSGQGLLPAGPSRRSSQRSTTDVGLEGIVVDNPSNDLHESTGPVAVPKPRPLNLADNYEIVGGVPTFVWERSTRYKPNYHAYTISSDGTRMAIREGWHKICVYDMLDNFSLVAKWEDTSYEDIQRLTFHNDHNDELVVVFDNSTIALMSLSNEFKDRAEHPNTSQRQFEALEIKQEFCILDEYKGIMKLRFNIFNHGIETWVCAMDWNVRNIVTLCCVMQHRFQKMQIKSNVTITPTFAYFSIPQNAVMLVAV